MATSSPPPPLTVNLWTVLTESKQILITHSRHFLTLSLLFLLPLCFSITIYPHISLLIINQSTIDPQTLILLLVTYIVFVTIFNLLAIGSVTHSVFQAFHGRQVKLISSVKSSFTSFLPLLTTLISSNSIISAIFLILAFAAFSLTLVIKLIFPGLELSYASTYFQALSAVVIIIFIAIVIKRYVKWILAWAIVVLESSQGLTPLKRSTSLVKGVESVSLSMIVVFSIAQSSLVLISNLTAFDSENGGRFWTNDFYLVQIVITSAVLTGLMLCNLAATTVFYMYCKAWEIGEEFGREYVSLPFDDGNKVPHFVSEN